MMSTVAADVAILGHPDAGAGRAGDVPAPACAWRLQRPSASARPPAAHTSFAAPCCSP